MASIVILKRLLERWRTLLERGNQNGLQGLRWLAPEALHEVEPHAAGLAAVHVPEEGIVDYHGVYAIPPRSTCRQFTTFTRPGGCLHLRPSQSTPNRYTLDLISRA